MSNHSQQIVQKLWNYCNILRDDGLSYGDYVEQLTYLLFLKMADEQSKPPYARVAESSGSYTAGDQQRRGGAATVIPKDYDWESLLKKDGDALETHYRNLLIALGKEKGLLGVIFRKAQNKIQDPAKLRRLIADLIDREQWSTLDADVKGDA
jgi:type I restriction enzyme M protein